MDMINKSFRLILASASPRRKEILGKLSVEFEIIPSYAEEITDKTMPSEIVKDLSHLKAWEVYNRIKDGEKTDGKKDSFIPVVIGSDTVVDHKGHIMGKPASEEDAFKMIKSYAGDVHQVHTGVCIIINGEKEYNFSVSSSVYVADMDDSEIQAYVDTGEPMDKAGGYAIQGLFAPFITRIEGDYYNIVGFPIAEVYRILKQESVL